jgi:hypothetical protein
VARRGAAVLAVFGFTASALIALTTPAFAGGNMHVEVNKVVVGTAPAGTMFVVHFACSDGGPSGDLSFDAEGNPVPAASNFFNDGVLGSTCTITETATGGASDVAYACEDNGVDASCASSGNEVTFDSPTNLSNNVTFTVTDTFADPVPPPTVGPPVPSPTPTPTPTPAPATAVAGAPQLTG